MSNDEIPPDVLEQARQAAEGMREVMNAPATGEPVQQATPDLPPDMSNVPDPYDGQGQEVYRAEQREQAVAQNYESRVDAQIARDAKGSEPIVNTPVGDLPQSDYTAVQDAGQALHNAGVQQEASQAASMEAAPMSDEDLEAALDRKEARFERKLEDVDTQEPDTSGLDRGTPTPEISPAPEPEAPSPEPG